MNSEDPDFTAALLGFNGEAVLYCQGISEHTRARLRVGLLEDDRRSRKRSRSFVCSGPIWPVRAKSKPDSRDAGVHVRKVLSVEVGKPAVGTLPGY